MDESAILPMLKIVLLTWLVAIKTYCPQRNRSHYPANRVSFDLSRYVDLYLGEIEATLLAGYVHMRN